MCNKVRAARVLITSLSATAKKPNVRERKRLYELRNGSRRVM